MPSASDQLNKTVTVVNLLFILGFLGIVWLIIYGNLSGNLGFTVNSQGANDTNLVINNITAGAVSFYGFAGTWFTITAVAVLIVILIGILALVLNIINIGKNKESFT